ncbi:phage/plasmid replication protein [Telluribacter sp. SYSU D00476]|uniref:phage/plasmid replication domain-containing protein n=1 Tax=Telluribacter sp. SYSU D00476 TaxID=2811430 RepID=UPI001FF5A763|nr:phage/plasmid replication protein [Telluribacter sp. SYSU D00476]
MLTLNLKLLKMVAEKISNSKYRFSENFLPNVIFYDTIGLTLKPSGQNNFYNIKSKVEALGNFKGVAKNKSNLIFGDDYFFEGTKVTVNEIRNEFYIDLSLAKYYNRAVAKHSLPSDKLLNSIPLKFKEIQLAFDSLSSVFNMDLSEASLRRLDITANLFTSSEPKVYYPFLLNLSYKTRLATSADTLSFTNGSAILKFYNKYKEVGKVGRLFLEELTGKPNLLRVEASLKSESCHLQNNNIFLAQDLYSKEGYEKSCKIWYDLISSISTSQEIVKDLKDIGRSYTWKDIKSYLLMRATCHGGGYEFLLNELERLNIGNYLNNTNLSNCKTKIAEIFNDEKFSRESNYVLELKRLAEEMLTNSLSQLR